MALRPEWTTWRSAATGGPSRPRARRPTCARARRGVRSTTLVRRLGSGEPRRVLPSSSPARLALDGHGAIAIVGGSSYRVADGRRLLGPGAVALSTDDRRVLIVRPHKRPAIVDRVTG